MALIMLPIPTNAMSPTSHCGARVVRYPTRAKPRKASEVRTHAKAVRSASSRPLSLWTSTGTDPGTLIVNYNV